MTQRNGDDRQHTYCVQERVSVVSPPSLPVRTGKTNVTPTYKHRNNDGELGSLLMLIDVLRFARLEVYG
jgi:hypothetical protein